MKNPYSIGKNIYLRTPTKEDLNGEWHEWFSDPEITKYLADRWWPNSIEMQESFFSEINTSKTRLVLSIVDKKTDKHIGVGSLGSINWVHRHADLAVVIGDKKFRKGIYSIQAFHQLISIAFNKLNLRNLRSVYVSEHKSSKEMNAIFGFEPAGSLKKFFFNGEEYVDINIEQLSKTNKLWNDNKLINWINSKN
tara:strand:+ start:4032 stop:4613 length:582 start_codon:yes stop_codon:yes gene_type:complete